MKGGHLSGSEQCAMRTEFDAMRLAQGSDLEYLSDASGLRHIGLRDVDGARVNHCHEIVQTAGVLACRDAMQTLLSENGEPPKVFRRPNRLLQPVEIQVPELLAHGERFRDRPRT